MDLAIDLTRTSGRPPRNCEVEVVRELNHADLAMLGLDREVKPSPIKRLRDAHHSIARLIAKGVRNDQIGLITGYSQSRISILKGDPAFQQLVSHYRGKLEDLQDEVEKDGFAAATAIRDIADEIVLDRLLDEPETVSLDQAAELSLKFGNLTGRVAVSRSVTANVKVDYAEQIAAGRLRAVRLAERAKDLPRLIAPGSEVPSPSSGPVLEADRTMLPSGLPDE